MLLWESLTGLIEEKPSYLVRDPSGESRLKPLPQEELLWCLFYLWESLQAR